MITGCGKSIHSTRSSATEYNKELITITLGAWEVSLVGTDEAYGRVAAHWALVLAIPPSARTLEK